MRRPIGTLQMETNVSWVLRCIICTYVCTVVAKKKFTQQSENVAKMLFH